MQHERLSPNHVGGVRAGSASSRASAGLRHAASAALVLGLFTGGLSALVSACGGTNVGSSSTTSTSTSTGTGGGDAGPGDCKGGLIVDGKCVAKCTPDKCVENNTCVGNACKLKCTAHTDCNLGQDCVPAEEDYPSVCPDGQACDYTQCGGETCTKDAAACAGDPACTIGTCPDDAKTACKVPACPADQCKKAPIAVCVSNGKAPIGASCPFGMECSTVTSCPDGRACDYTQCGGMACTKDDAACGADAKCTIGACPDKSPCVVPGCAADQCKPTICRTAGEGDALAYCSINDCHADADCPGGYKCGLIHDPHEICGANPKKGNNNFCGKTSEACVDPANFAKDGATYLEGSTCLLRNACTYRIDCDPCTNDLDCSQVGGQRCVPVGPAAELRCASVCTNDKECGPSYHCVGGSCTPRFAGGCKGTGKFCEPCQTDEDCGSKGSTVACVEVDSSSGERACLDLSFPDMCMVSADCPTAPGGKHAACGNEIGAAPGDTLYQRCYLPYNANTNKFSCW